MNQRKIGAVKGYMVNWTTKRLRVYGTEHDIGVDLDAKMANHPEVVRCLGELQIALSKAFNQPAPAEITTPAFKCLEHTE